MNNTLVVAETNIVTICLQFNLEYCILIRFVTRIRIEGGRMLNILYVRPFMVASLLIDTNQRRWKNKMEERMGLIFLDFEFNFKGKKLLAGSIELFKNTIEHLIIQFKLKISYSLSSSKSSRRGI